MGSGFMCFKAIESARGTAGVARAVAGMVLVLAGTAMPARASSAGESNSKDASQTGSRPASVALCTVAHGGSIPARGFEPLWKFVSQDLDHANAFSLQIQLDPETGTWGMASPAGGSTLGVMESAALSRFSDDLVEEPLPNGGVMLNLRGRFQTLSVAGRSASGGVRFGCAEDALGLHEWLRPDAPVLDAFGRPVK